MDGSFSLQRDPLTASPPPDEAGWQREIDNARAGHPPTVSTKAAAYYVGVHYKTFLVWVRDGIGPQPIRNPVKPGTTALNQRMRFSLGALEEFQQSRSGDVLTRGARTDAMAAHREVDRLQAAIERKVADDLVARARDKAKRVGVLNFASLDDLIDAHPWARIGERLVGHAWAVDDATFQAAGDDLVEATLEEALAMPWVSEAARAPFVDAFLGVLRRIETALEAARTRQRSLDLDDRLSGAREGKGPRPFAKEDRNS